MVTVDKRCSCYLFGLSVATDSNKQVSLTDRHLKEYIFVCLFVLVDNLPDSHLDMIDMNMVLGCKELIEYFLQIPSRAIETLIIGMSQKLSEKDYPNRIILLNCHYVTAEVPADGLGTALIHVMTMVTSSSVTFLSSCAVTAKEQTAISIHNNLFITCVLCLHRVVQ